MSPSDLARRRSEARRRNPAKTPKTIGYQNIDFDVFASLLSFYVRTVNLLVSQDLDREGWKQTVDEMAKMSEGTDDDFAAIAAYLTKAFPPK